MITNPNVKINLGLNILRKRGDGFHDLETLFVPYFGITDTLEIILATEEKTPIYKQLVSQFEEAIRNIIRNS